MAIYLPWLTVLAAALFACGALLSNVGASAFWTVTASSLLIGCVFILLKVRRLCWLALLPTISFLYAQWCAPHPGNRDLARYIGRQVIIKARVSDKASGLGACRLRLIVAPRQMLFPDVRPLSGRAELVIDGEKEPIATCGDAIKITGFVASPMRQKLAWQSDTAAFLAKQSIYCVITADHDGVHKVVETALEQGDWSLAQKVIEVVRDRICSIHIANLGSEAGSLLTSMVLGERAVEVDATIKNAFRTVGLSHLIAASGFNLTVVTAIAYWLARFITRSKLFITIFAMFSMLLFVALAGLSASVLRAALMCSLVLLARCAGRSLHAMAGLAVALLLTLLIEPVSITDAGCQLSYAATAGIICGAEPLARVVVRDSMPKLLRSGIVAAAVVIAAQLAIIPIQIYYFWQIGLLFLPANLTVSFLVAPVTILGFASSLIAALPTHSAVVAQVVWVLDALTSYPLKVIIFVANYFASFKAAVITLGPPCVASIVIYYLALAGFIISLRLKRARIVCLVAFCFGISFLVFRGESAQLTFAVLPRTVAFFGSYRNGFVLGEKTRQLERFLAFNGAHLNGLPCAGKSGNYCLDEYLIASSKCDFALLFPHESDQEPGRTPELELPRQNSSGKPLLRIFVLQLVPGKQGYDLSGALVTSLKVRQAIDWIFMIQTDQTKSWHQMNYSFPHEGLPSSPEQTARNPESERVSFTLCPHRKVTILPVQVADNLLLR